MDICHYGSAEDVPYKRKPGAPAIGIGAGGTVYKAITEDNVPVALKEIILKGEAHRERVNAEISLMRSCKHPNILYLLEAYMIDEDEFRDAVYLATYPLAQISLERFFEQARNPYAMEKFCPWYEPGELHPWPSIMNGCLDGLAYLHEMSPPIRHRDLKPANILLYWDPLSQKVTAIIIDFGISKQLNGLVTTTSGTEQFKAPEQLREAERKDKPKRRLTTATDVFSLGCCFALIEGVLRGNPSPQKIWDTALLWRDNIEKVNKLLDQETLPVDSHTFAQYFAFRIRYMVKKMMRSDPKRRPTARQCQEALNLLWDKVCEKEKASSAKAKEEEQQQQQQQPNERGEDNDGDGEIDLAGASVTEFGYPYSPKHFQPIWASGQQEYTQVDSRAQEQEAYGEELPAQEQEGYNEEGQAVQDNARHSESGW